VNSTGVDQQQVALEPIENAGPDLIEPICKVRAAT